MVNQEGPATPRSPFVVRIYIDGQPPIRAENYTQRGVGDPWLYDFSKAVERYQQAEQYAKTKTEEDGITRWVVLEQVLMETKAVRAQ